MPTPVIIRHLGLVDYADTYAAMRQFSAARDAQTPDELWLLEHPPVYTLGTNSDEAHLLERDSTPVFQTDRGGQVTWHGPGQAVVYVLLDLQRSRLGVRELVCRLEKAIIAALAAYNIAASSREGAPGVYCDGAKIASLGLRIRKHRSYHGIAVNVCNSLAPFTNINPCGYEGLAVTRTRDLQGPDNVSELHNRLLPELLYQLELSVGEG
jgi:lipoyl(octanoyl) transferase